MPPRAEGNSAFKSPPLGCDCHFHVFGPAGRYPYGTDLRYAPPLAPLGGFLALARRLGLERFVFVQPSAYGRDNRCMLDAMREVGTEKSRGIVDIDENAPDAEISRLHAAGVRGVRINVSPVRKPEAGLADALRPKIMRTADICRELGWHVDLLLPSRAIS
jgi:2-pyrone-4,6-dicarboxylate lactonase